jgi:pimeloyl-ACP methyl ester carboxylesterase
VTEYPFFVPYDGEHIAAIVCVPDTEAKSFVLCIQGLGAPRSHRYGLWVRTARRLAEHGIASVRFDYPQVGDSTGVFKADMDDPPLGEARTILSTAQQVLGIKEYGLIGNCLGLLAGLEIGSQDPNCKSIVCLLKDPPKEVLVDRTTPNYQLKARRMSRKMPRVRSFVRRFVHVKKGSWRQGLTGDVARALRSNDVLFLFTGKASTGERLRDKVTALHSELRKKGPVGRFEVTTMEVAGTEQFQLPLTTHPLVIDAFVEWMTSTLPSAPRSELHSVPDPGESGDGDAPRVVAGRGTN